MLRFEKQHLIDFICKGRIQTPQRALYASERTLPVSNGFNNSARHGVYKFLIAMPRP